MEVVHVGSGSGDAVRRGSSTSHHEYVAAREVEDDGTNWFAIDWFSWRTKGVRRVS